MSLTNFPNGITSFGVPVIPGGIPFGKSSKTFFVDPVAGLDGNKGTDISRPLKTLSKAHSLCTSGANDVVFMISRTNTSSDTTDYQSAVLTWSKDACHLIGINAGGNVAQRSRIAQLSTATNIDNLFTVSGNNCIIANIHVFHGVADATSKGAVSVSGSRNHFINCHLAGIGHADMDTADNYSLSLSGSENLFEGCTIGLDTIARGSAANYEMVFSGGATRNTFKDCSVIGYAESATNYKFLKVAANGIDRWTLFKGCVFMNMPTGIASGTTMNEAFDITGGGSPDGLVLLKDCTLVGATDWESNTESARVFIDGAAPTNNTSGLAVLVEAT